MSTALIRFHGSLNDFLFLKQKDQDIPYFFPPGSTAKDAIEALGVPHVEISAIVSNGDLVDFNYLLRDGDVLAVYPFTSVIDAPGSFILDVHLGKLARQLRMLGFDVIYKNDLSDGTIAQISEREKRIVLTRDIGLLKHKIIRWGYWLRSQQPLLQLKEVLQRFQLYDAIAPFKRCITCNHTIAPVEKAQVIGALPEDTARYYNEFYKCSCCMKVYWKGSHYEKMSAFIESVRQHR